MASHVPVKVSRYNRWARNIGGAPLRQIWLHLGVVLAATLALVLLLAALLAVAGHRGE